MNFLPIVEREMRVAARRKWTYWTRFCFALAGVVACATMYFGGPSSQSAKGEAMVMTLGVVAMIFAGFSGCFLTADCVSSEKRDGTLGLLFLTDLRGYDIVCGKLAANVATTSFGLLSLFPVFFLPLLNGGVTWAECLRILGAVSVTFVLSLTLGLLVSTFSVEAKKAVLATFFIILFLAAAPILYLYVIDQIPGISTSPFGVPQFSPACFLYFASDDMFQTNWRNAFWGSAGLLSGLSLASFILASISLPFVWNRLERAPSRSSKPKRRAFFLWRWLRAKPSARLKFNDNEHPYATFLRNGTRIPFWVKWIFRILVAFALVMIAVTVTQNRNPDDAFVTACFTVLALHIIAKFVMILEVTRPLLEDRRSGALELLLSTPVREGRLLDEHIAVYRRLFRRTFWTLLGMNGLLLVVAMTTRRLGLRGDDFFLFLTMDVSGVCWLISDFQTIHWFGMREAVTAASHLRAALQTLLKVIIIPWIPFLICIAFLAAARADEEAVAAAVFLWTIIGFIVHSAQRNRTKWKLVRQLRPLAAGMPAR